MSPGNLFADFTVLVVVVLAVAAPPVSGQRSVYPSANLSTLWVKNKVLDSVPYEDGLASPVGENATLELTGDGDLVLREKANGRLIWSSGTSDQSVRRMEITEQGNLVLFGQRNMTVWQSFDHPTDALVPGQSLLQGKMLRANASPTNWTEGKIYITVLRDGVHGYVESTPPQLYFKHELSRNMSQRDPKRITFTNGSLSIFLQSTHPGNPDESIQFQEAKSTQYISNDMVSHQEEVIQMMKLAMWCLQNDSSRRPSMSMVVKVLEGAMSVENCLDYSFFNANSVISAQGNPSTYSAPPQESILSGPR
ncbi:hypothetical protein OsI_15299 [Oryza sativa Indica Group]|uniref:non-specific serine/threonine protein kinase n=1 Tax=Oryza sativa subsp. indica TaxID=39946 RepID=A2XRP4_ORYSI|nr:hypothetical protein OsI_15299 [Oryza sativa Indica Group]